jgi:hypothetical protein
VPIGSFSSSNGGSIHVEGSQVIFPADAISTASGEVYSGQVNLAAVPLYTSNPDLLSQMPGDLVGRDEDEQYRALGSFGMIAVELTDNNGNLLQVTPGKKVTIEFPIADAQQATAPSSIPLWYFDETKGFWVEEGEAIREGDKYVMEVGHFSFWNCDAPFDLITLTGSVVYSNGDPAEFVFVCVEVPGLNTSSGGLTDDEGIFEGKVPANQELIITVKDHNGCEILLSDPITVGPFTENVTIPPITIDFQASELTTITGELVDCDGEPVEEGIVQVRWGNQTHYLYLDESNAFEYSFYNCDEGAVTVIGYDYANEKESLPITLDHAPEIDFGTISVCEDLTEYLIVHVDGQDIGFVLPHIYLYSQQGDFTVIQGANLQDSSTYFYAVIPGQGLGTFTIDGTNGGGEVFLDLGFGNGGRLNPGVFTFTYWGDEGDFIQGTMEGTYIEINFGTQDQMEYPFTGEFKILRD